MENLKVVIVSEDLQYSNMVCSCIRSIRSNINISAVKDQKDIDKYDLVLLDNKEIAISDKPCCYIVENEENLGKKDIYKYSRATEYINRIVDIYYETTGIYIDKNIGRNKPNIITFSSAKGGTGCSSIAYAMAKDYAMSTDEDIFYLSLGRAHEEMVFFKMNKGLSLKDYIYRLFFLDKKSNINSYLVKNQYGIKAFNILNIENELISLDEGEFSYFLRTLIENTSFKKILIDTGASLDNKSKYLRKIADCNIYIRSGIKSDFEEEVKLNLGLDENRTVVVENMRYKGNPKFDEFFETENQIDETIDVGICEEKEAFVLGDGKIDIEIDGEFGKGIRNLISYMANKQYI